jgi:uncharacterized Rmd1/YagE family protein
MSEKNSTMKCAVYCLALRFDISALASVLSDSMLIRIIKGALLIEDNHTWSVVFDYGAVVHWNVSSEQQVKLHQLLLNHAENPLSLSIAQRLVLLKIILKSNLRIPF